MQVASTQLQNAKCINNNRRRKGGAGYNIPSVDITSFLYQQTPLSRRTIGATLQWTRRPQLLPAPSLLTRCIPFVFLAVPLCSSGQPFALSRGSVGSRCLKLPLLRHATFCSAREGDAMSKGMHSTCATAAVSRISMQDRDRVTPASIP